MTNTELEARKMKIFDNLTDYIYKIYLKLSNNDNVIEIKNIINDKKEIYYMIENNYKIYKTKILENNPNIDIDENLIIDLFINTAEFRGTKLYYLVMSEYLNEYFNELENRFKK